MTIGVQETLFAPAERSSQDELERQVGYFREPAFMSAITDAVPNILLILNRNRQIVHANRVVLSSLEVSDPTSLIGRRPGEVMHCVHAFETEGGCGTTESCSTCGGARAILASQRGEMSRQECRILQHEPFTALDLRVSCTPITVHGEIFSVYAATDIADEKRKDMLERIFFHDVLNTAGGLQMYLELLSEKEEVESKALATTAHQLTRTLIEEIKSQQVLLAAERGVMQLTPEWLMSERLVRNVTEAYRRLAESRGCDVAPAGDLQDVRFQSDDVLLRRILGNMTKNAIEASVRGSSITVGCKSTKAGVEFWVHNEGHMPREVQLQIFQRSFSTKGKGRGIGTYSIKLLGERYLGGIVSFTSTPAKGTTFRLALPHVPVQPSLSNISGPGHG